MRFKARIPRLYRMYALEYSMATSLIGRPSRTAWATSCKSLREPEKRKFFFFFFYFSLALSGHLALFDKVVLFGAVSPVVLSGPSGHLEMSFGKHSQDSRKSDLGIESDIALEVRSSSLSHLVTVDEISSMSSKSVECRDAVIVVPSEAKSSRSTRARPRRVSIHGVSKLRRTL